RSPAPALRTVSPLAVHGAFGGQGVYRDPGDVAPCPSRRPTASNAAACAIARLCRRSGRHPSTGGFGPVLENRSADDDRDSPGRWRARSGRPEPRRPRASDRRTPRTSVARTGRGARPPAGPPHAPRVQRTRRPDATYRMTASDWKLGNTTARRADGRPTAEGPRPAIHLGGAPPSPRRPATRWSAPMAPRTGRAS